jgi:hypothetical protein
MTRARSTVPGNAPRPNGSPPGPGLPSHYVEERVMTAATARYSAAVPGGALRSSRAHVVQATTPLVAGMGVGRSVGPGGVAGFVGGSGGNGGTTVDGAGSARTDGVLLGGSAGDERSEGNGRATPPAWDAGRSSAVRPPDRHNNALARTGMPPPRPSA